MKILVVAGEASADLHVSHVMERLAMRHPLQLVGIGGRRLQAMGLVPVSTPEKMAVIGLVEAVKKIRQTFRLLGEMELLAARGKPDVAFLSDLPDFNLRLAPRLRAMGIPVVYYSAPQVWAWRSGRVHQMAKCIDRLLTLFPFEKKWYADNAPTGLDVRDVGHPVVEQVPDLPYRPDPNLVAILPGSREGEWRALWPDLEGAAKILAAEFPQLRFEIPLAETLRQNPWVRERLNASPLGSRLTVLEIPSHEVLRRAKVAMVASGTATLETAVVGTPMAVVYRVAPLSAFLFRHLVRYKGAVAMANLVHVGLGSEERVVPELLQEQATPDRIAGAVREILTDPRRWEAQARRLSLTRNLLASDALPSEAAAREVESLLEAR
ncbi:MAG: lipid-A-disaccharide synthase [Bdellovibrionales bacterium]|nr:lipid-A-disaccharide synthase [Bdellovibrionales bacterium]